MKKKCLFALLDDGTGLWTGPTSWKR